MDSTVLPRLNSVLLIFVLEQRPLKTDWRVRVIKIRARQWRGGRTKTKHKPTCGYEMFLVFWKESQGLGWKKNHIFLEQKLPFLVRGIA